MAISAKQAYGALNSKVASINAGIASWAVDDVNKTITATTKDGQTLVMHFTQPSDGVSVTSVDLVNSHVIVTFSDNTTHDAGTLPSTKVEVGTTQTVAPDRDAEVTEEPTAEGIKLNFKIPRGESGSGGALSRSLNVTQEVGGLKPGDSYSAETGIEKILHDMLDPVMYPTFTAPSANLAATGAKLLETGATLSTTMTVTFNRGAITPDYGTSGYRAGAAEDYSLNGGTAQASNTFSVVVDETQKTYQAAVSYAAGEQPKDSTGGDYSTPLAAGSVNTNTITYEFVDALWANTAAIGTVAKLALVSKSAKQKDLAFPAQTVANPEVFDVPASWTVSAVQVKNDLSGQYEDAAAQFTVTDTTHDDAAGNSVAYKRYTFNLGYGTGSRTVRVKWS